MTLSILSHSDRELWRAVQQRTGRTRVKRKFGRCHLKWQLIKTYCFVLLPCLWNPVFLYSEIVMMEVNCSKPWCSQNGDYHGALLNLEPPTPTPFWHLYQLCLFKDEDRKKTPKKQQSSCWETNIESPKGKGRSHQLAGKYREHNMSNRQGASRRWQNPSIYRIAALFSGIRNKLVLERKKTTFSFKAKDKQDRQ